MDEGSTWTMATQSLEEENLQLRAQLARNEKSRLHWVKVRKELIKKLQKENKDLSSRIILTHTDGPQTFIEVKPPLCPKCGEFYFSIPRMGIYHKCKETG